MFRFIFRAFFWPLLVFSLWGCAKNSCPTFGDNKGTRKIKIVKSPFARKVSTGKPTEQTDGFRLYEHSKSKKKRKREEGFSRRVKKKEKSYGEKAKGKKVKNKKKRKWFSFRSKKETNRLKDPMDGKPEKKKKKRKRKPEMGLWDKKMF
jgi:hypothetical protein